MTKATLDIDSIENLGNGTVLVVCRDEASAKTLLKKNPRAAIQRGDDSIVGLVYDLADIRWSGAIGRA
jgi:hypothetical protein